MHKLNLFLSFSSTISLLLVILLQHIGTNPEGSNVPSNSPSPATLNERGQDEDTVVVPPSLVSEPSRPKYRDLKSFLQKKKPMYEEFLDSNQRRILEAAVRNFGLFYSIFPVKRDSGLDTYSLLDDEGDVVRAFEVLSTIVSHLVRDTIICSADKKNNTVREMIDCYQGDTVVYFNKDVTQNDDLCSSNDPDYPEMSEECALTKKGKMPSNSTKLTRGPALDFTLNVFSANSTRSFIRLPQNGALKEAQNRQLWNSTSPTKIIVTLAPYEFLRDLHILEKLNKKMIAAYIEKYRSNGIFNIVRVDWPEIIAKRLSITQLATRYLATAEKLAQIILRWYRKGKIQLDHIHFIGTSFGAHLVGVVADIIKLKTNGQQVARITGLDPIGWGFDETDGIGLDSELKLSKCDAVFVDVIHTSSPDPIFPYIHYGSSEKLGTVDFYPNNGRAQYCGITDGLCHHFYSVILFIASIKGTDFNACKCPSWNDFIIERKCSPCADSAIMGEHVDKG